MSDNLLRSLDERVQYVCRPHNRYRTLWVIGLARSGKTPLLEAAHAQKGWPYIDFTLDAGCLDSITGREETYRPSDFLQLVRSICDNSANQLTVLVDEVEPLLALWSWEQQDAFFELVGNNTDLACGLVLATRIRTAQQLRKLVPSADNIFEVER